MGRGRPSGYNDEIADLICKRLADGESLIQICRDPDMPHRDAVRKWLSKHDDFLAKYARAREDQAETLADQIHEIAQTEEDVNRARLRIDAIKWHASKLKPRVYGDNHRLDGNLTVSFAEEFEGFLRGLADNKAEKARLIDHKAAEDVEEST